MTDLKTHIQIFQSIFRGAGFGFAKNHNALIRMVWHIATEHQEETTCEDFIKAISGTATTTNKKE